MMQSVGEGKWGRQTCVVKRPRNTKEEIKRKLRLFLFSSCRGGGGNKLWTNQGEGVRNVTSLVPFMGHAY